MLVLVGVRVGVEHIGTLTSKGEHLYLNVKGDPLYWGSGMRVEEDYCHLLQSLALDEGLCEMGGSFREGDLQGQREHMARMGPKESRNACVMGACLAASHQGSCMGRVGPSIRPQTNRCRR